MAYFTFNESSLNVLWDSVNCVSPLLSPLFTSNNHSEDALVMDIYTAANIGDYDVVYHALTCGDDRLLKKNENGWSPLMYASYSDHDEIVQLLIASGVDKFDCNIKGQTPLMFASLNGNEQMLKILCEDYIINMTDKRGWSALFYAVSRRRDSAVKFLLKCGADVNLIALDNGYTVLMVAAAAGKTSVVKMLLAAGTDPSKISWQGETAISIAHSYGFFDIVRLLSPSARFCELPLLNLFNLFKSLALVDYLPFFDNRNIDIDTFYTLTEEDLKDIGVNQMGPRKKMASTILQWQQRQGPSHTKQCSVCRMQYS